MLLRSVANAARQATWKCPLPVVGDNLAQSNTSYCLIRWPLGEHDMADFPVRHHMKVNRGSRLLVIHRVNVLVGTVFSDIHQEALYFIDRPSQGSSEWGKCKRFQAPFDLYAIQLAEIFLEAAISLTSL